MKDTFESPQEQLDLITSLVQDSRTGLRENAFPYIAWGGTASAGSLVSYLLAAAGRPGLIGPLWLVLSAAAETAVILYYRNRAKTGTGRPARRSSGIFAALWLGIAFGAGGIALVTVLSRFPCALTVSLGFLSVLLGLGYLVSSVLTRWRILGMLGLGWMLGGFSCFLVPQDFAPALVGALSFFLEFIPGIFMYLHDRGADKR